MAWTSQSSIQVDGLAELDANLNDLEAAVSRRLARAALRNAARLFADAMKRRVHRQYGKQTHASGKPRPHVIDDIRVRLRNIGGQIVATIGASKKTAYILNWLEFGTKPHEIVAKEGSALAVAGVLVERVRHPGAQKYPVIQPAFNEEVNDVVLAFKNELATGIDAQLQKRRR